jgi:glucose/arabinose dehydrogenase
MKRSKMAWFQQLSEKLKTSSRARLVFALTMVAVFALLGWTLTKITHAATSSVAVEAEAGARSGNSSLSNPSVGASANQAVRFGATASAETPQFTATTLVSGLNQPWEIAFLPTGEFLFSQKVGSLSVYRNGAASKVADIPNVKNLGEGGLMGIAVDPEFTSNRYIYACYFSQSATDVRVSRWKLNQNLDGLTDQKDIITGIRAWPEGRHAGCRTMFSPTRELWVTTGDGAFAGSPQDLQGLAGKILRVDRDGKGLPGNLGGGADPRIFSYGHRNVEGIAFFPTPKHGVPGVSDEHGTDVDDEINELRVGNFGWSSLQDGADLGLMTDKGRFPNAIDSIWSSGNPTQAPSGSTIITGAQWKGWNGTFAMTLLKAKHLTIFHLDDNNKITKEEKVLQDTYGRIRTVVEGTDGNLYLSTDNKADDKIIRLTPQ